MIRRGDLWWADLGEPGGSAPAVRRPVLIVSSDGYNRSRIATVVCVAVTSNLRLGAAPGNVTLTAGTGGLPKDSVVNVSQVVTLNKSDLAERVGNLDRRTLRTIEAGLRRVLGL
ncbi:MAG: type II toxin-antitoxin system PemK/MazF family toxin [Acidimicrobiia bacterium]